MNVHDFVLVYKTKVEQYNKNSYCKLYGRGGRTLMGYKNLGKRLSK
jgi:hypothetical protein